MTVKIPQKCQDGERQRLRNCPRFKETKVTWQLNTMCSTGSNPRQQKDVSGTDEDM